MEKAGGDLDKGLFREESFRQKKARPEKFPAEPSPVKQN
jgi:hypothetical protein